MEQINEGIIRKIQNLLAKGKDAGVGEAEASLYMAKAQELLAKYNMEYSLVMEARVEGGATAAEPEKREKTRMSRSAQYQWQRELWKALAQANFCWHSIVEVLDGKRASSKKSQVPVKRHMVLGRQSNVLAVQMMGEYLEDSMERLVVESGGYANSERMSRGANSWKRGCAERLVQRIEEAAEKRKDVSEDEKPAGSTALVLRSVYEREEADNYEFAYGIGSYARKLLRDAEWEQGQEERNRRAQEAREKAERDWLEYLQNETPVQKAQREKREEKERVKERKQNARDWRRWRNEQYREASKVDSEAYCAGKRAGDKISLAAQVGAGKKPKELS